MEISFDHCRDALKLLFPAISDWKSVEHGMDHLVFVSSNQVVRFPWVIDPDRVSKLKREYLALKKITKVISADIPNMTWHENLPHLLVAVSYPFLEGSELRFELVAQMPTTTKQEVAKQLGRFLSELHGLELKPFTSLGFSTVDRFESAEYAEKLLQKLSNQVLKTFSKTVQEFVHTVISEYLSAVRQSGFPIVITHADIQGEHLLWHEKLQQLRVIDFGDLRLNDPAYDFSFLGLYGADFLDTVLKHYSMPIDATFLQRTRYHQVRFLLSNIEERLDRNEDWANTWFAQRLSDSVNW